MINLEQKGQNNSEIIIIQEMKHMNSTIMEMILHKFNVRILKNIFDAFFGQGAFRRP